MSNLYFAPTQALPWIEVQTPTGPLTSYPFGAFDLTDPAQRAKFGLFDALTARVRRWAMDVSVTYADSDLGISVAHSGTLRPFTDVQSIGAAEIVIPGWTNPHSSTNWSARHTGELGDYVLAHGDFSEEVFSMDDVRIVSGADDETTPTTTGDYEMFVLANNIYNNTSEGPLIGDDEHVMVHTYTYRTATLGYLAFILVGEFDLRNATLGGIFEPVFSFASQDYFSGSVLIIPSRPCGTLTINWPNPTLSGNPTLTLTCPIFGTPSTATAPHVTFTCNVTLTPSESFAYGGIYNADGTTNANPLD